VRRLRLQDARAHAQMLRQASRAHARNAQRAARSLLGRLQGQIQGRRLVGIMNRIVSRGLTPTLPSREPQRLEGSWDRQARLNAEWRALWGRQR